MALEIEGGALQRTVRKTGFGSGYGSVVRQTTKYILCFVDRAPWHDPCK